MAHIRCASGTKLLVTCTYERSIQSLRIKYKFFSIVLEWKKKKKKS